MKRLILSSLMGALAVAGGAQAADAPDFFLKGTTARVEAMGRAFVAVADDATAVQFNPAGLAGQRFLNLNTTYSTLNDFDINTNTLNYAQPVGRGNGWGAQLYRNTIGNILGSTLDPVTFRPVVTGTTDEDEFGLHLGYGWRAGNKFRIGAALKYLNYDFFTAKESGWAFDLGALVDFNDNWKGGLNIQNIGGLNLGPDQVPTNLKIGTAYVSDNQRFTAAFDVDTEVADETQVHVGVEYKFIPELAARIGSNDGDFTAGLGLDLGNWALDYSFNDQDLGDLQKITLVYRPKARKEEPKKAAGKAPAKKAPAKAPAKGGKKGKKGGH